jgi:hypothetical protein
MKALAKNLLARAGLRLERVSAEERLLRQGYDPRHKPSPSDMRYLSPSNRSLRELERSYRNDHSALAAQSLWAQAQHSRRRDLRYFRGDNLYLWQYTRSPILNRYRYFIYACYVRSIDSHGLLDMLHEDGAFGCFTFDFDGMPTVSRDLLDSVNEITFLGEHAGLFSGPALQVLDIGAGYGRLAHRLVESSERVSRYWCVDAIARSTFLCEYYLRYRGISDRASVLQLPDVLSAIEPGSVDLAVNVHSFSEMPQRAVAAWIAWISRLKVPTLFVVPNEQDHVLSREEDGSRIDCSDVLDSLGYSLRVSEPTIRDAATRGVLGVNDHFLLYTLR